MRNFSDILSSWQKGISTESKKKLQKGITMVLSWDELSKIGMEINEYMACRVKRMDDLVIRVLYIHDETRTATILIKSERI